MSPVLRVVVALLVCVQAAHAQNWYWSNPMPHGNDIIAMKYYSAEGIAVEACDSGQIYTSSDWSFWTPEESQTTNSLQAIGFLGDRIILTGEHGTVVYSDDGFNYVYTNLNTANWLVGVAASSNLAVAVGDSAAVYTSTNGAAWTLRATPPGVGSDWLLAAAYGNGKFVIVGEGGYLAYGSTGTNWTQVKIAGLSADINDVEWISDSDPINGFPSNSFLAVCENGAAYYSTNSGTNWKAFTGTGTNVLYSSAGTASSRLAVGGSTVLYDPSSTNLLWREETNSLNTTFPAPDWTYYTANGETNDYYAGGQSGMLILGTLISGGDYDWFPGDLSPRDFLWQVIDVSNSLYVAVGDNARIMTSLDGVEWAIEEVTNGLSVSSTNTTFFGVGGTTNLLLAVGSGGSMSFSPNNQFTVITTNDDGSLSTNTISDLGIVWENLPAIETNDDLQTAFVWDTNFYVIGGGGVIYSSGAPTNPASWKLRASGTTNYLSGIDLFSNTLVCVGNTGTILTSLDGITWTKRAAGTTNWLFRVHNCDGTLVAVGENGTILTSSNAINWTSRASGTTNWLNDVEIITNEYFVVGDLGTLLTSTNGATWASAPIITDQSIYGAASMNGQLVVTGVEGTILRSQIVPDLSPLTFIDFSVTGGQCYFEVGTTDGNTDVTFTLDSSPDLLHWTTGPQINITDDSGTVLVNTDLPTNSMVGQYYRATLIP
jgi:hypothetical protein